MQFDRAECNGRASDGNSCRLRKSEVQVELLDSSGEDVFQSGAPKYGVPGIPKNGMVRVFLAVGFRPDQPLVFLDKPCQTDGLIF
jgi:hypothetical protein